MAQSKLFDSWAIVELLGHVRHAGRVSEEQLFGGTIGRCDVPSPDGTFVTVYFSASSLYSLTVVSEEIARGVASESQARPVSAYEMRAIGNTSRQSELTLRDDFRDDYDHGDDDDSRDMEF